ncbi:MAG: thioredoxin domain-containing protein [Hyphomicrobiaceae bacterium]
MDRETAPGKFDRRSILAVLTGLLSTTVITGTPGAALAHQVADVAADIVAMPGELPEIIIGKVDAKIAIIEYASMTCGHCASFHKNVLPALREKYLDTGKARLIFREFPLDDLAVAASMLIRCASPMRTNALLSDDDGAGQMHPAHAPQPIIVHHGVPLRCVGGSGLVRQAG